MAHPTPPARPFRPARTIAEPAAVAAVADRLEREFSGVFGYWAHSLDTGETFGRRCCERFSTASTIKLPILIELYRQVESGRVRLSDRIPFTEDNRTRGSGVLRILQAGLLLTVRDAAALMICVSDNSATNMLIDLLGMEPINRAMRELGYSSTVLNKKIFWKDDRPLGLSTPADLGRMLVRVARVAAGADAAGDGAGDAGAAADARFPGGACCRDMLDILAQQQYNTLLVRDLPGYDAYVDEGEEPAFTVASKSGSVRGVRNDVGLFQSRGRRWVFAVMSRDCADRRFVVDNEAMVKLPTLSAAVAAYFGRA